MSDEVRVVISGGKAAFIYSDALAPLMREGDVVIARASHVEPCGDRWTADMGPSDGPMLGPFNLRGEALQAERDWLREHRGL